MSAQPLPAQAKDLFHYLFEQASLGIAVEELEQRFAGNRELLVESICHGALTRSACISVASWE